MLGLRCGRRSLGVRIDEHKDYVNKDTVVANNIKEMSHMFYWENVKILHNESD